MTSLTNVCDWTVSVALEARHLDELRASAITDEVIQSRGYRSVTNPDLPSQFKGKQRSLTGLLIPITDHSGRIATYQLKSDTPRVGNDGKPIKYETAIGGRLCVDVPQLSRQFLDDTSKTLWITEGAKKVDSALSHGLECVIGLLGVWNWRSGAALPDWNFISLQGRDVVIAFDSDVMRKDSVRKALDNLSEFLVSQGAEVRYCLMPDLPNGDKCGLDDWFFVDRSLDDLHSCVVDKLPEPVLDWEPPIPLFRFSPPKFPDSELPPILKEFVAAVSEATQTPPDLAGTVVLGAISAATRGTVEVAGPSWTEPMVLQVMPIAEPGSRKSAVIRTVTDPIRDWERERRIADGRAYALWEAKRRMLEKRRDAAERKATRGQTPDLESVVNELYDHENSRPVVTRVLLDDSTPEATKSTMCEQGGPAAVISAEPTFFSNIAGRYQNCPNLDAMLMGHAGDAISVIRKGRESEEVDRAVLTICVTVQPDVVRELGRTQGFMDRGAAARLLPAFIPDTRGMDDLDAPALAPEFESGWSALLRDLLNSASARLQEKPFLPLILRLDEEAERAFHQMREAWNPAMAKGGLFETIPDWGAKLPGAILRIAGVLHVAEKGLNTDTPISKENIHRALALGEYFTHHALHMYRLMRASGDESHASEVLEVAQRLGKSFTKRDLFRALHQRARFQTIDTLDEPLALLEAKGWIRPRTPMPGKRGRPSQRFDLNPLLPSDNSDKNEAESIFVNIVMVNGA